MANPNATGGVAAPRSLKDLAKPGPALRQSKIAARNAEKMAGRMEARSAVAAPAAPAPMPEPAAPAPAPSPTQPWTPNPRGNQPWWWNPNRAGQTAGSAGPTSLGGAGTAGGASDAGQEDTSMDSFWEWMRQNGYAR